MTKPSRFAGTRLGRGFATDKTKEQDGVWRVHDESGIHVRVRRSTLPEHKLALRKHYKPFSHLVRVDPKNELLIKQKAGAEVLVADWGQSQLDEDGKPVLDGAGEPIREKLVDADGNEIRPTVDNVLEAFIDMPDFFDWVTGEADTFENYRVELVEAAAGNSQRSSLGSESGERPAPAPFSSDAPLAVSSPVPQVASPS